MPGPAGIGGRVQGRVSGLVTSARLRRTLHTTHALARRLGGRPPTLHYFHGVADPWSHLAVQLLPALAACYRLRVVPHLVGAPADAVAPDRDRLAGWSLRDAGRLAQAHGLAWPEPAVWPDDASIRAVESALAAVTDAGAFSEAALALGNRLWRGEAVPAAAADPAARIAAGNAALRAAGHYLSGVFAFEGECYWGVDRLPHLEARLAGRREGPPLVCQLEAGDPAGEPTADVGGRPLHFFLSLRSPYSYLAAARVRALADRHRARLVLRPLLPMVMRGLPVPANKRLYIVRDARREADRLGLPFGRICDPVGAGVERGLAVLHRAIALGRGPAFAESFLSGAFAEAIDATTDAGLGLMAERAGLAAADVRDALADEGWRAVAEANRAALLSLGLWGVPSFRVADMPPHWGQDRLWAVEQDLCRLAGMEQAA